MPVPTGAAGPRRLEVAAAAAPPAAAGTPVPARLPPPAPPAADTPGPAAFAAAAAAAAAAAPPQPSSGGGAPRTGGGGAARPALRTPATAHRRTPAGPADPVAFVSSTPGYDMSPYRPSDEEDDDFDDDDDENTAPLVALAAGGTGQPAAAGKTTRRGKTIPAWARTRNLVPILRAQETVDPDTVFQAGGRRFNTLDEIFADVANWGSLPGAPGHAAAAAAAAAMGSGGGPAAAAAPAPPPARLETFARRTSSGDWVADRVTREELAAYKRAMRYADS